MSQNNTENNDASLRSTSLLNIPKKVAVLVNRPRTVVPYALGILIAVLLGANLLMGDNSSDARSDVIYSEITTTTVKSPAFALVEQSVQLINSKQYDAALTVLDLAIDADPNYGLTYYNQGVALQLVGKFENAISSYTKALSFNNNDANSYYNRGLAQRDLGQLDDAEKDLRIAVVMKKDWAAAMWNLGQVLKSSGEVVEGEKLIAEAQVLNPKLGK
jgi:tetratricopeptide (TPR) repeat protein